MSLTSKKKNLAHKNVGTYIMDGSCLDVKRIHKELEVSRIEELNIQNSKMKEAIIYFLELDRTPKTEQEISIIHKDIIKMFKDSIN